MDERDEAAARSPGIRARRRSSGPRGEHDREGFATLVAEAAEAIVRAEGVRALGMRRLAAAIGYAPNSIYNAVGDLDQVVLRVNARSLGRLHDALAASLGSHAAPREDAVAMAEAYLAFVGADPAVWSLVHAYPLSPETEIPDWHGRALARAVALVDRVLAPLIPEAGARGSLVAALWAALHGLAALATSGKLQALSAEPPEALARALVARVLGSG